MEVLIRKSFRTHRKKNVFLIAGFNLPLLLELAMNEDKVTEEELLDSIEESRKKYDARSGRSNGNSGTKERRGRILKHNKKKKERKKDDCMFKK